MTNVRSTGSTPSGIAFDEAPGSGPPVVLIHAGIADRRMWDAQWPALTASRPAVRLDLRGFGDSRAEPAGELSHVTDVLETLDHLGIRRCHLVGASFGAGVAVETTLTRPELVESLLLCPPGGALLAELTADLRRFFEAERDALAREDLDAAVAANVETWVVGDRRAPTAVDPAVVEAVGAMQRRAFEISASWPADLPESELDPPALERLSEITARTLVLVGGHDLDASHDAAARVVGGVSGAQRIDWPEVAHLPSIERPQEFLDLILEWTAAAPHRTPPRPRA